MWKLIKQLIAWFKPVPESDLHGLDGLDTAMINTMACKKKGKKR